jgi:hypothetical protein
MGAATTGTAAFLAVVVATALGAGAATLFTTAFVCVTGDAGFMGRGCNLAGADIKSIDNPTTRTTPRTTRLFKSDSFIYKTHRTISGSLKRARRDIDNS